MTVGPKRVKHWRINIFVLLILLLLVQMVLIALTRIEQPFALFIILVIYRHFELQTTTVRGTLAEQIFDQVSEMTRLEHLPQMVQRHERRAVEVEDYFEFLSVADAFDIDLCELFDQAVVRNALRDRRAV